ncbi:MAG TPA: hypothetical protein VGI66_03460 [Streptosporangiaceae bacterium]|jgi:hypothetical protein
MNGAKTVDMHPGIRTFTGTRPAPPEDYAEKGITNSGLQPDYEGVIFSDGTVVIRWLTAFRSHSVWQDYDTFYQVHGHPEYGTRIVFGDGLPPPELLHPLPVAEVQ